MKTRILEISAMVGATIFCLVAYIGKKDVLDWHEGFAFSHTVSMVIIALIAVSLLWMLVRTLQKKLVGRRIVFLYVGIAISLPLFMSLDQNIVISDNVRQVYKALESLEPGSKVLVSFDYDPPSAPELQPMAETFLAECFARKLKVIIVGLWPMGPLQANQAIDTVMARMGMDSTQLVYGRDYVNLGYQAGSEFVIQRIGTSFEAMFANDVRGTPYQDLLLVRNIKNFSNIDYSFNLSSGFPGTPEWVQVAASRYGLRMGAGNTAVQAPTVYPYLRAGQIEGLLAGMNGAAEFEKLTGRKAKATIFMLSQTFAHVIVIAFIIIGNVAYFRGGRKSALKGGSE